MKTLHHVLRGMLSRTGLWMMVCGAAIAANIIAMPHAQAIPPAPYTCISGGGPFATFRDCDLWPDGSFYHQVYGGFIGYGGFEGRVCDGNPPVATDWDPATPCPGVGTIAGIEPGFVA